MEERAAFREGVVLRCRIMFMDDQWSHSHPVADLRPGIYAILLAPFGPDQELNETGIRTQVRFCQMAGARGIVAPAVFSEFYTLSDFERLRFFEVASEASQTARLPFIAVCSGTSGPHATVLAKHAEAVGASAVMLMPPYVEPTSPDDVLEYFRRVASAVDLPLILQNPPPLLGWPLQVSTVLQIIREVPLRYVKEEAPPEHHHISALIREAGPALQGVFAGMGGLYFLAELRRGASGLMPSSAFVDVHVRIYDEFAAGNVAVAQRLHRSLLPAIIMEGLLGPEFSKEVLRRRGVLSHTVIRTSRSPMDNADFEELDRLWPELQELFTVKRFDS